MIVHTEFRDLDTPTGPMRTHVYAPAHPTGSKRYPGLLLYPEIYQQTGPIVRLSMQFAGHGYVVMAPEIYHEHEPPGTVMASRGVKSRSPSGGRGGASGSARRGGSPSGVKP